MEENCTTCKRNVVIELTKEQQTKLEMGEGFIFPPDKISLCTAKAVAIMKSIVDCEAYVRL